MPATALSQVRRPSTLPPWVPLLVFAAAWLAHGSVLGADWIGEDAALVRDNAVVARGPSGLGAAFGRDAWTGEAERGVWRPLTILSFCLESPLWSGDGADPPTPFGFHLTNLCLHGFAAVLLLLLAWRLVPARPVLVAGTALVFAVHPLHAQAVASLAGRADLLALLFSLLAAWFWVEAGRGRLALLPLAALSLFLALLSKETAVGVPLVLVLLDRGAPDLLRAPRRGMGRLAAYAVLLVPLALWALRWPGATPDLRAGVDGLGGATIAFFVPVALVRDLLAATGGAHDLTLSPTALGVGAVVLAGGAAVVLGRLGRGGPVALALASTALLWSAAVLVSPAGLPLLPRFAYVPAVGLFLIGGALLRVLWSRPGARGGVGAAAVVVLLAALGALTWHEGRAWRNADTFERALIERRPGCDALLLRNARRLRQEAVIERRRATTRALDEIERDALNYRTTTRLKEARTYVRAVLRRADPGDLDDPRSADAHRELGFVLQELARTPESVLALREALRVEPWLRTDLRRASMPPERRKLLAETFRRLAAAEQALGELRESAIHLEHAAELQPDDVRILYEAGRTLSRAGEHARARVRLERALELAVDADVRRLVERDQEAAWMAARRAADTRLQEARGAVEDARYRDAVSAYEEALAADPTLLRAYHELAFHLGQWFGRYGRAYEVIDAAERMLAETGHAPEDVWWARLRDLRAKLKAMERKDLEEERDG